MDNAELLEKIKENLSTEVNTRSGEINRDYLEYPWITNDQDCAKEIGMHIYAIAEMIGIENPRCNVTPLTNQLKRMRTAGDLISHHPQGNGFVRWWPAGYYADLKTEVA